MLAIQERQIIHAAAICALEGKRADAIPDVVNPGIVREPYTAVVCPPTHVTELVAPVVNLAGCHALFVGEMGAAIALTATRSALGTLARTDEGNAMSNDAFSHLAAHTSSNLPQ